MQYFCTRNNTSTMPWNIDEVRAELSSAFDENSETQLLNVIRENSFLLWELYDRKYGIRAPFREISFGGELRCDFAWLNDNSDGPEWVLVELESPHMPLFRNDGYPTAELNHGLEQIKSWRRYFDDNPGEKRRIFGAVARFRYILVAGSGTDWATDHARKWRVDHNRTDPIEIRSSDIFIRALELLEERQNDFWSFEENPVTLSQAELRPFWEADGYMGTWRQL